MFIKMSSELFEKTSIDTGVSRFRAAEGAVLLDVRTPEEYRNGHAATETYYRKDGKPEGIPSELADVIIRIFDYCGYAGIDIEKANKEKHEFNESRPYRHGGKVC